MLLVSFQNLSFKYKGSFILEKLDFSYDDKDFLVITGPNGCGKSTLLKLILGLLKSKEEITLHSLSHKDISYVPQYTKLKESLYLRVLDLVLMATKRRFGFYNRVDRTRAFYALKRLKILHLWDKKLSTLSGGQRQKAFIARAICERPRLLLLDEPTSSVDMKSKFEIFDFLKALHKKGMGIIMVSHDINTTLMYTKKIALLDKRLIYHDECLECSQHFCDVELALSPKNFLINQKTCVNKH